MPYLEPGEELPGTHFGKIGMLGDAIYRYVPYTRNTTSLGEEELLNSPWLQRLRRIRQLQNAYLVFPAAEHSRFVHSVGVMDLAGRWATHLYPSLKAVCPDTPGEGLVVETLRLAGLLHDVGHGPLAHLYDEVILSPLGLNHEEMGRRIIQGPLASTIKQIAASPYHDFGTKERIDPNWIAQLIGEEFFMPQTPEWVKIMRAIMTGPISADNLDYLPRDCHQLGIPIGGVDVRRIFYYSFIGEGQGLSFHFNAAGAVTDFLLARLSLYQEVYFHRTARSFDLAVRDILPQTISKLLGNESPANLEAHLKLTDFGLMEKVREWEDTLGQAWSQIFARKSPYRLACEIYAKEFNFSDQTLRELHENIVELLPNYARDLDFVVDLMTKAARSLNPLEHGPSVKIYDAHTGTYSNKAALELFRRMPEQIALLRVYNRSANGDRELAQASQIAVEKLQ